MNTNQRASVLVGVFAIIVAIVLLVLPVKVALTSNIGSVEYECGSVLRNNESEWLSDSLVTRGITTDPVGLAKVCSDAIDSKRKVMAGFAIIGAIIGVGGMLLFKGKGDEEPDASADA